MSENKKNLNNETFYVFLYNINSAPPAVGRGRIVCLAFLFNHEQVIILKPENLFSVIGNVIA